MRKSIKKIKDANPPEVSSEILTDKQASALLAVESRTLRLWRHTRGLPHIKITRHTIRYRRSEIEAWLDTVRTVTG